MLKRNFKQTLFNRRSKISLSGDHVRASGAVSHLAMNQACQSSPILSTGDWTGTAQPLRFLCVGSRSSPVQEGAVCRSGNDVLTTFKNSVLLFFARNKTKASWLYFKCADFQTWPDPKLESEAESMKESDKNTDPSREQWADLQHYR